MLDFLMISSEIKKQGVMHIYPKFLIKKSSDLMIRGGDFYAIWIEELGQWSTDENHVIQLIDEELKKAAQEYRSKFEGSVTVSYMWDSSSGMIDRWHKYCQKQCRDSFHPLDEKIIFSNDDRVKEDYSSKRLSYPLESCDISAYEKLISTLYDPEERTKIEWAIGAIVSGDSKSIQKFMVLYGAAGTGKSTILNIIERLFDGYYSVFDARALGSTSNVFALEAFRNNPLVAIQHDGDLSRIEDNTRLNSLVSHEYMTVNEKYKATYTNRFKAFLFMGTNKPVKITDAKSGLIRRLIDVTPSGNKVPAKEYKSIMNKINFELGGIAKHCLEVYESNPGRYDDYIPTSMLGASNDFYNFIEDSYSKFESEDGVTLKVAWEMYKKYCEDAKVLYPLSRRPFKEEMKNYFEDYQDRVTLDDGTRVRNYYSGFISCHFDGEEKKSTESNTTLIKFEECESIFDVEYAHRPAQYATLKETPSKKWVNVTSTLSDIDTRTLHYVKVPENHIVIDFDIQNKEGEKLLDKNIEAASLWPPTYAELSKSGKGVHLHYIYDGDASELSRVYDENIEIKVFRGNSSLRRRLTKCNRNPISVIKYGLPLKGDNKNMINTMVMKNEKGLRTLIKRNLNKEIHPGTKPSIDFINKILEDAYNSDLEYDVSDMYTSILAFGADSTHHAQYCIDIVMGMKFKSKEKETEAIDISTESRDESAPIVFFDVEVFPNLFIVNWKYQGEGCEVVRMINPKSYEIDQLLDYRLIGFNNRRYDNHILYGCLLGYSNEELFELSQRIIKGDRNAGMFGSAYNLSYTDVYDFASAGNKKSLKKWEIELGIHHQELGLPWDEPVPEDMWLKVAEYCDNDVLATEAVFNHLKGDWVAREILADISGLTVNDTTNTLSTAIIFEGNKHPQNEFNYRNLAEPVSSDRYEEYLEKFGEDYNFRVFDAEGIPQYRAYIPGEKLPEGWSILPFFKDYVYEAGKSTYMGEVIGEGGKVYTKPGMYADVWDGDITGQHPSTMIAEVLFGPRYTKRFKDIVDGRVSIKHEAWDDISNLFDGKLLPYVERVKNGELTVKDLANALKTVVNSVYGLTKASFDNEFRDIRNVDNIGAKRGALFMTLLKSEVEKRGFEVCHIKTDSIKIPGATEDIKEFISKFSSEFGYSFETEAQFDRFCIVNKAVYIAKEDSGYWNATGAQFAEPYVYKTLFTKEPIEFKDYCATKSSKYALYLDMNESLPDVSDLEKERKKLLKDPVANKARIDELDNDISKGHDYHFVGKVGSFCPIKPGEGGGILLANQGSKYDAVTGTKGYRWLEAEMVRDQHLEDKIDVSYFNRLVDEAVEAISELGDFEWFIS